MFEIKYEIFEDDILELGEIGLKTFNTKFNTIYGCFTIMINGIEYISYPSSEMRLETKRIYSELIVVHFNSLIDAYTQLKVGDYVTVKYIENSFTWLEFIKEGNKLIMSELNIDVPSHLMISTDISISPYIRTGKEIFIDAKKGDIFNEIISWGDFESELISKSKEFIKTLQEINKDILTANCFDKVKLFASEH
ncbi:MAG: hypothetical protein ACE3L7_06770 [Candidatus Pristimantibacillus sp.]